MPCEIRASLARVIEVHTYAQYALQKQAGRENAGDQHSGRLYPAYFRRIIFDTNPCWYRKESEALKIDYTGEEAFEYQDLI